MEILCWGRPKTLCGIRLYNLELLRETYLNTSIVNYFNFNSVIRKRFVPILIKRKFFVGRYSKEIESGLPYLPYSGICKAGLIPLIPNTECARQAPSTATYSSKPPTSPSFVLMFSRLLTCLCVVYLQYPSPRQHFILHTPFSNFLSVLTFLPGFPFYDNVIIIHSTISFISLFLFYYTCITTTFRFESYYKRL